MEKNRLWLIAAALAAVVVIALGWFFGVQPQLAVADSANEQRRSVDEQNDRYEAELAKLQKDNGKRDAFELTLAQLEKSVPYKLDYARFLGELATFATKTGVAITSVTSSDPQPYAPVAGEAPAATAPPAATESNATEADATETDAPAAPEASTPATATDASITAQNFVVVPVQITITGSNDAVRAFLGEVQRGPRLFLVNSFSTSQGEGDPNAVTGNIGGLIYGLIKTQ